MITLFIMTNLMYINIVDNLEILTEIGVSVMLDPNT